MFNKIALGEQFQGPSVFERQYPVVVRFVQHLAYNRGLNSAWDRIKDPSPFWASTTDGHLKLATIVWCNVFSSYKGDLHWTKTPAGNTVEQAREGFRFRVLSKTGFPQERWEDYHKKMLSMRDKYVAHLDVKDPMTTAVPLFDTALQVAYAYDEWVRDLTEPVIWEQPTLISKYEQFKAEASSIVTRQPLLP